MREVSTSARRARVAEIRAELAALRAEIAWSQALARALGRDPTAAPAVVREARRLMERAVVVRRLAAELS
jgi:hypothetical protein